MEPSKLQKKISAVQLDQVYESTPVVQIATTVVVLMTLLTLWNMAYIPILSIWAVMMILSSLYRLQLYKKYRRRGDSRPVEYWEQRFRLGSMISGLLLGASSGFMLLNHDLIQNFVLLLISVGMVAGAVSSLSPHLRIFKPVFFLITIPYLTILLSEGLADTEHGQLLLNLGLLYVVFIFALYTFSITANRRLTKGLHHRFENEVLADNLRAEARLRAEMHDELLLAERIIANVKEGIIVTDKKNRIIRVNEKFSRITGYSQDEVIDKSPNILNSGKQDKQFYMAMWQALSAFGEWQGEIWNRHKNGEIYPEWLSISVIRDANDEPGHYVGWFRDITERKREEERLAYLANYDMLTGLPNRKLFLERLDNELADIKERNEVIALLFVDLNHFKYVNDNYGHDVGDVLLKQVAMRLKSVIRDEDLVARLGGDEFVILLRDMNDGRDAAYVADKLIETIDTPFYINQNECRVGFAIGISLAPEHSVDRRDLLRFADMAMYKAKQDRSQSSWVMSQGGE